MASSGALAGRGRGQGQPGGAQRRGEREAPEGGSDAGPGRTPRIPRSFSVAGSRLLQSLIFRRRRHFAVVAAIYSIIEMMFTYQK